MREDVIFQYNSTVDVGECPVKAAGDAAVTSHIGASEVGQHLAGPVNVFKDRTGGCTVFRIIGVTHAWSIRNRQEKTRAHEAEHFDGGLNMGGPVEEKEHHRRIAHHCRLGHPCA
jgi:hypothetical protein